MSVRNVSTVGRRHVLHTLQYIHTLCVCRYNIMLRCWATEADDRLAFAEIVATLEEYLGVLMEYADPTAGDNERNDPYANWSLAAKGYSETQEMTLEMGDKETVGEVMSDGVTV